MRTRLDSKLRCGPRRGRISLASDFAGGGFALLMSNTRIEKFEDLKGKKVWIPEGDVISRQGMEALSLSPVTLPLTDVLTGLQTGLIDIVGMSPIGALVLQWHTKLKYISELPLLYTFGFMAIDKKAFYKLSERRPGNRSRSHGPAYIRALTSRTSPTIIGARDAMLNTGIETVSRSCRFLTTRKYATH